MSPAIRNDALESVVEHILARGGDDVAIAAPLGLGKPNHLLNAIYRRIKAEPDSAPVTSFAGQPMLKSMMSAPACSASLAPLATHSGVRPTS